MRGSRNFRQGCPGQSNKKTPTTFFFVLFFKSSAYFTEVKWLIPKKTIIFQGFGGGPTFSRRVQRFPGGGGGGSNCFFPIETHITCDFPGGSGPPVPPPSGSALATSIRTYSCKTNKLQHIYTLGREAKKISIKIGNKQFQNKNHPVYHKF